MALADADIENDGKLTKADSRASAVAKLRPFAGAVMWDVGAGSGAVAIEFLRLAPQSRGFAIDKHINQIDMARRNAKKFGVSNLQHIHAEVPSGLDDLPVPDAVFIGGGLSSVTIDTCITALRDDGVLVGMQSLWKAKRYCLPHGKNTVANWRGFRCIMPIRLAGSMAGGRSCR